MTENRNEDKRFGGVTLILEIAEGGESFVEDYEHKLVLVVGLGRSGQAAASLLARKGAQVKAVDLRSQGLEEVAESLGRQGVDCRLGGYDPGDLAGVDLVVVSPGVPPTDKLLGAAYKAGIEVVGELELAYRHLKAEKLIAVTGSNGKSTTTTLVGALLTGAGISNFVAGNIGSPLSSFVDLEVKAAVVEVSTFQLETTIQFHPDIAVLLNITPDHIDRHGSFEEYARLKGRIFSTQTEGDIAVINFDDPTAWNFSMSCSGEVLPFSTSQKMEVGAWLEEGFIWVNRGEDRTFVCPADKVSLPGLHNMENILASSLCALVLGAEPVSMSMTLQSFSGLPHRIELVAEIDGVLYFNDSKATNVVSMEKALESFSVPLVVIAGGRDKGSDFAPLASLVKERVKSLVLIGEAAKKLEEVFSVYTHILRAGDLATAVRMSREEASPGDVVLLSPGCASFDQFDNFEHRGDLFREEVLKMKEEGR